MVTLYAPGAGEEVRSTHVGQFVNLLTGAASGGALVRLNEISDSANYSVIVGNQDTTNGYALKVQYGPVGSPTTLATFQRANSRIQSASGSQYVDISNTGVTIVGGLSITGTLTYNGGAFSPGLPVFNVLDYGIQSSTEALEASAGASVRATNVTRMGTLVNTLVAAGGGDIEFPPHLAGRIYPFNPLTLTNSASANISIGLRGHGFSSKLVFYGVNSTAHGIDMAGSAAGPWRRSFIRDLVIEADTVSAPTGGALIRLQTVNEFDMENLWLRHAWSGIEIGASNITGVTSIPLHVRLRNVDVDLRSGSSGDAIEVFSAAGVWIMGSTFDGDGATSTGLRMSPSGTSASALTYNMFDSLWVVDSNFNGHRTDVRMGDSGTVANVFFSRTHVDGNGIGATSSTAFQIETQPNCTVENIQISDPWVAVYASSSGYGLLINDTSGTIRNVTVIGGYFTGAKTAAITLTGTPENVIIANNIVNGGTAAGNNEIDVLGGTGVTIIGNVVNGPSNSGYGIIAASGVANLVMVGNNARNKSTGSTAIQGTTSSTRVFSANI